MPDRANFNLSSSPIKFGHFSPRKRCTLLYLSRSATCVVLPTRCPRGTGPVLRACCTTRELIPHPHAFRRKHSSRRVTARRPAADRAWDRTGRTDIGLELGLRKHQPPQGDALGLRSDGARRAPDAALRVVQRNYPLISGLYSMVYTRGGSGGTIRFLAACPLNSETKLMHADILVGSFHAQLSRPLAAALSPVKITFGAERPRHARRYFEMAPGGVEFLPDIPDLVRIFLPNADLDKRPAMANAQTFRRAERTCRQQLARLLARNSWRGWAEDWIRSVEYASPNLKAAAAAGNCSTRTLDRRLREEGTSFRKMVAEVRHQQAKEWLAEDHARVSDVAARLGYNEVGNFSRAFRRAAGKSPRRARVQNSNLPEQ